MLRDYDVVLDGTDNFPTRYLLNDACVLLGKPHVWGSIYRFDGQVSVWWAEHGPCYRCVFPTPPPPGAVPSCAEGGVLGVLCAAIGSVQATETLKLLLGIGEPLVGRLLVHDALAMTWDALTVRKDPGCPVCGESPTVFSLVDYDEFCGVAGPGLGSPPTCPWCRRRSWRPSSGQTPRRSWSTCAARTSGRSPRSPARWPSTWTSSGTVPRSPATSSPLTVARIVVMCKVGGRSAEAARLAQAAGYTDVLNLDGGVLAWVREVDPTQPVY